MRIFIFRGNNKMKPAELKFLDALDAQLRVPNFN